MKTIVWKIYGIHHFIFFNLKIEYRIEEKISIFILCVATDYIFLEFIQIIKINKHFIQYIIALGVLIAMFVTNNKIKFM